MSVALEAVYERGVFRPLDRHRIRDGERVRLLVEAVTPDGVPVAAGSTEADWMTPTAKPTWLLPLTGSLAELLRLPPNWDSYGAQPVSPRCVAFALGELLPAIMQPTTPPPSVVPTSQGGVQFEWHARGIDLEVEVAPDEAVTAYWEDREDGSEWEGELNGDFRPLVHPLGRLSEKPRTPESA